MKIGDCQLGLYEKALSFSWDMEKKLNMVKELGYDAMEFSVDADHKDRLDWPDEKIMKLRDLSLGLNVPMNTIALTANRFFPLGTKDDKKREDGKTLVKKAVVFARKLGVRIVQIAAYDEYEGVSDEETDRLFLESMRECVRSAALGGVMLALETMDTAYANGFGRCKRIVDIIGSPWLQIYGDTGNIAASGLDFTDDIKAGAQHILAMHLKDATPGISRDIDFGTGIVDFERDLKALKKAGFSGFLIAEMWWQDDPGYIDKVRSACVFLREKIRLADTD